MEKRTIDQLETALLAVRRDLAPRAIALAEKSSAGALSPTEKREYESIVRLNDMLSILRLEVQDLEAMRVAR